MYRDYSGCYILFCLRFYIAYWFLNETPSYLNSICADLAILPSASPKDNFVCKEEVGPWPFLVIWLCEFNDFFLSERRSRTSPHGTPLLIYASNSLHKSSILKFMMFIKQQKGLKLIISSSDTCSHFTRQLKLKFSITFVLIICSTIGGRKIFWKEDGGITTFSHTTTHVPCTHFFGLNQVVNFFIEWNMYYL